MNLRERLSQALEEDIGSGDLTSEILIPADARGAAILLAKAEGVLCGLPFALEVFRLLDGTLEAEIFLDEGSALRPGEIVVRIKGNKRALLSGERTALNLLCHLSGIATHTFRLVQRLEGSGTRVLDTRKTTPLWRDLEKYAVRTGGGHNHRFGLYDMILIKDNHIVCQGGITPALRSARLKAPPGVKLEIEARTFAEFEEAMRGGADWIMLDNMSLEETRRCVEKGKGKVLLEASGGIKEDQISEVAATGVDFISIGALTHSSPALDISMEMEENEI